MIAKYTAAQIVGLALVVLAVIIWLSWLIRSRVKLLQRLYVPTCVIGGFTMLLLGPQVLGALTGTAGLLPQQLIDVWRVLPGILINIVFGAIMIGKKLPSLRDVWALSAPHFIFGSLLSFGQFALGAFAVLFFLGPVFGVSPLAGALIEMSFAGGHGTVGGMGPLLTGLGAADLIDVGLGLATVSMITGIVLGTALVSYAMRTPKIPIVRRLPLADSTSTDLGTVDERAPADVDEEQLGIGQITAAFMYISLAILIALVILESLRFGFGLLGSDIFDSFPLFPLTVVGGFIVQLLISKFGAEASANKKAVQGIATFALDMLVVSAIGTMSLATLGANIPALLTFTVIGAGWSVVALLWLGPRIHRENWFEHGLADFGQSQGNVATGFVLADMADPKRTSKAATAYGYKQLTYEPLLGGGLITAMAVPVIAGYGLLTFGIGAALVTLALIAWGVLRKATPAAVRH